MGRQAAAALDMDSSCTGVDELEDIDRKFQLCLVPTGRMYLKKKKKKRNLDVCDKKMRKFLAVGLLELGDRQQPACTCPAD